MAYGESKMRSILRKINRNPLVMKIKFTLFNCLFILPVKKNRVIFDNFGGRGFGDDPKYIALELIKKYPKLELVWLVNDLAYEIPPQIKKVKYATLKAAYYWATSRVWIDNIKTSYKIPKKKSQYYIQTWHSTLGFKKNEQDAIPIDKPIGPNELKYKRDAIRDAKKTDLMYSNNDFRYEKYQTRYWYTGKVKKMDVPRLSPLLHPDMALKHTVYTLYGIPKEYAICLYAPTFRNAQSLDVFRFNYIDCIAALEKRFGKKYVMLVRLHPNIAGRSGELGIFTDSRLIDASKYPDMQELLAVSNVLITDYSGCMFDFGFTHKPVFLFAKDYQDYLRKDRGTYFKLDEVPFTLSVYENELFENILHFSEDEYYMSCGEFEKRIGFNDSGEGACLLADIVWKHCEK